MHMYVEEQWRDCPYRLLQLWSQLFQECEKEVWILNQHPAHEINVR